VIKCVFRGKVSGKGYYDWKGIWTLWQMGFEEGLWKGIGSRGIGLGFYSTRVSIRDSANTKKIGRRIGTR
jgi:hypothetical protein